MNKQYKLTNKLSGGRNMKTTDCDKKLFPELPSILKTDRTKIKRIIAIGDIHGDLELAIKFLLIPKLIKRVYKKNDMTVSLWYKDEAIKRMYEWIGTETIVVQVGDQVDRCRPNGVECIIPEATRNDESSDLTIMFFYNDINIVASKVDCALFSLLGNHELINVLGNVDYVSYKGLIEFGKSPDIKSARISAFSRESTRQMYRESVTLNEFLGCGRLATIIVDGYLFVHAGIMKELIDLVNRKNATDKNATNQKENIIPTINQSIKEWLLTAYDEKNLEFIKSLLKPDVLSPFWPRIFGTLNTNLDYETFECKKYIAPILEALDIKGIIVGHTPQIKMNINSTCSNTVWRIDMASSQAFDEIMFKDVDFSEKQAIQEGRIPQVLEIILATDDQSVDSFNVLRDLYS